MFIIHRLSDNILDSTIGNIRHRNNIVTGVIATDNGNGTYDVYIAGADVPYPNVPTTLPEPDFSVDDPVEIAIEYGNKEMPIIIGNAKKIVQEFVEDEVNVLVTTIGSHTIAQTSAYLDGRIEEIDGYENCTKRGFYYGMTTDYGLEKSSTGSFAAGSYSLQATPLTAGTTYHFQAFVNDVDGDEQVGDDKTFITTLEHKIYTVTDDQLGNYYIKSYSSTGNLIDTWTIETTENIGNALAVDNDENVYTITHDQHNIKKRNSAGTLILTKNESDFIYDVAIGPDDYIYTWEYGSTGAPNFIAKRNRSDLVTVDTLTVDPAGNTIGYGLTIDSDSKFYFVNHNTGYEKWTWGSTGRDAVFSGEITFASLATVGVNLANVDWMAHAILTPKDLSGGETDYELTTIESPMALGMQGSNYLVSGYSSGGDVFVGKYTSSFTESWATMVSISGWLYGSVGAYPF